MNEEITLQRANKALEAALALLDIPESYYEKAVSRYESIAEWLHRPESGVRDFDPAVYAQGSFRLGTVIKPLSSEEGYDLDLVCRLMLSKQDLTQKQLKDLVGVEVKSYSKANHFKSEPEDGKRCWTQQYQDEVNFHMDILPSIPNDRTVMAELIQLGVPTDLAAEAIAITDKEDPNYNFISVKWPRSNPKGYAMWFERRMDVKGTLFEERRKLFDSQMGVYASIDDVPLYKLKTPLQRVVQLLKRHRDETFRNTPEDKPISIIITTLAAHAYNGEADVASAMATILQNMERYIFPGPGPRIPNPVDPGEDFADRWDDEKEELFREWLWKAQQDFAKFGKGRNATELSGTIRESLGVVPPRTALAAAVPLIATPIVANARPSVTDVSGGARPWSDG